jgi:hypothetical protein
MFWIQYVVDYDRQEQQQLATRLRERVGDLQRGGFRLFEGLIATVSGWWGGTPTVGGAVTRTSLASAAPYALFASALGLALFAVARRRGFRLRAAIKTLRGAGRRGQSPVAFYERMTRSLAARGLRRAPDQTPLEFAATLDAPEALLVTRAYNRVRFGARALSGAETARVEEWLRKIEKT